MQHFHTPLSRRLLLASAAGLALAGCGGGAASSGSSATTAAGAASGGNGGGTAAPDPDKIDNFDNVKKDDAAAALLPERITKAGKITVVMNVSSAPTKFFATDNKSIIGLNPDIARALGKVLGVTIDIQDVKFDGIIPGLQASRYDLAVSSMAPTAERVKVLDMLRYGAWGTALCVAAGNPQKLDIENMCGKKIAVQQGSVQANTRLPDFSKACTAAGKPAAEAVILADQTTALLQLSSGRVDGVLADTPVLGWAIKQQKGKFELAGEKFKDGVSVALNKDSDLTKAVQAGLNALMKTQAYKDIYVKWGMDTSTVPEAITETGQA